MSNSKRIKARINKLNKRKKSKVILGEFHWDMTKVEKAISIIGDVLAGFRMVIK